MFLADMMALLGGRRLDPHSGHHRDLQHAHNLLQPCNRSGTANELQLTYEMI